MFSSGLVFICLEYYPLRSILLIFFQLYFVLIRASSASSSSASIFNFFGLHLFRSSSTFNLPCRHQLKVSTASVLFCLSVFIYFDILLFRPSLIQAFICLNRRMLRSCSTPVSLFFGFRRHQYSLESIKVLNSLYLSSSFLFLSLFLFHLCWVLLVLKLHFRVLLFGSQFFWSSFYQPFVFHFKLYNINLII